MSLLLKSVWRNVLRSSSLSKTVTSASLSSSISEATRPKSPDALMVSIKTAPSESDILAAVTAHITVINHKHMLQALRSLFELHKSGRFDREVDQLVKDPAFGVLCQHFKKHARCLDVGETVEATKVLSYLKVPVDSLILQTLLQIIKHEINSLDIRQIMFLDFILQRFHTKNHLVDALKLALPLAFQVHLALELDREDFNLLKDMLAYTCSHSLPDRCINNVVTGLLLHDQVIDAHAAKSIIWSLCQVNCTPDLFPTRVQLLQTCCDVLSQNMKKLSYDDVLRTAAKLKGRILEKHVEFYHEQMMDAVADFVIEKNIDFEKGLLVARVLSRIAHTHLGLVKYLCSLAVSSPTTLSNARTNILFGFVNCLSNNNFDLEPQTWNEIKRQISTNPVLDGKASALPWVKFSLELASLGHYEDRLLERVFSPEFLQVFLSREENLLDYLQLLTLNEAVGCFYGKAYQLPQPVLEKAKSMYPVHAMSSQLEEALVRGMKSPDCVVRNVVLPSGIVADLLICVQGGHPIKLPVNSSNVKIPIESLNLPSDGIPVCLMNYNQGCFSMNSNRLRGTFRLILDILEHQGYATVAVNINEWMNAPAHEQTPFLLREVGYKCAEIGMKLSTT